LNSEDYAKKILLQSGVKVATSNPPVLANPSCDDPAIEESLEWLSKSPEYETWKNNKSSASLWLHGAPGDGKTFAAAYVLKSLSRQLIYTKKRLVASIFCSSNDSDIGLVTALALQLILQDKDQAYAAQEIMAITDFQKNKHVDKEIDRNMWKLLETLIITGPNYETVIIIDGIDELSISMRTSFLENFCALQANIQGSMVIRVLISSRPYPDIKKVLGHYPNIERDKERKGKQFYRRKEHIANNVKRVSRYPLLPRVERTRNSCRNNHKRRKLAFFQRRIPKVDIGPHSQSALDRREAW
jgi:hypothetical protein